MTGRMQRCLLIVIVVILLLVAAILLGGCRFRDEPVSPAVVIAAASDIEAQAQKLSTAQDAMRRAAASSKDAGPELLAQARSVEGVRVALAGHVAMLRQLVSDIENTQKELAARDEDIKRLKADANATERAFLRWGMGGLAVLGVAGVGLGLYLRSKEAIWFAGMCGGGVVLCITLLTFWKAIAWAGLLLLATGLGLGLFLVIRKLRTTAARAVEVTTKLADSFDQAESNVGHGPVIDRLKKEWHIAQQIKGIASTVAGLRSPNDKPSIGKPHSG